MKKLVLLIVLALAGVLAYYLLYSKKNKPHDESERQQALAVSKHSPAFLNSVDSALNNYYNLSESFVNWDSGAIRLNATNLKTNIANIKFDELKKDSLIYETATSYTESLNSDLDIIIQQPDITAKRKALNSFSQNLYDLLRAVHYDGSKIFLQECPMAFNDAEPGLWLSNKADIRNPYLGLHHPKYKSGMLECGEIKDSLHLASANKN